MKDFAELLVRLFWLNKINELVAPLGNSFKRRPPYFWAVFY